MSSSYANSNLDVTNYKAKEGNGRAKWGSFAYESSYGSREGRTSRNGPVWLEKSLSENRESDDDETMSISVRSVASFLRGQNVPVDPFVMAEREDKRRKAMELQEAIKEQLKERELMKKIEKEKRLKEEKMEEDRLKKQMELEKERLKLEKQLQMEKQENEKRKQEAMKLALEKAELDAKLLRDRKKRERALSNQANLDEIISIEKHGNETEIVMDGCQKKENDVADKMSKLSVNSQSTGKEDIDDGETILIGTPIKLKKKNLDSYRKKTYKKQHNVERDSSDDELSTTKSVDSLATSSMSTTTNSSTSTSESSKNTSHQSSIKAASVKDTPAQPPQGQKMLTELDGIALILQTMTPFVPLATLNQDLFGLNQFNLGNLQLAYLQQLQQQQSRLNTPIIMPQIQTPIPALATTPQSLNQNKSMNAPAKVPEKKTSNTLRDESIDTGFESEGKTSNGGDKDSLSSYDSPTRIKARFIKTLEQSGVTGLDERNFVIGRQEAFGVQKSPTVRSPEIFSGQGRHDTYAVIGKQGTFLVPPEKQENYAITRKQDVISEFPEGNLLPERREFLPIRPQTNPNPPRNLESFDIQRPQTTAMTPEKPLTPQIPAIPHDGTFTKDDIKKQDACTSTWDEKNEIKVLTPQKYRVPRIKNSDKSCETVATQTDSVMFCEFCCFHQHCHHALMNGAETTTSTTHLLTTKTENLHSTTTTNQEIKTTTMVRSKSKEKNRIEDRPQWGVNKPSIQYVKASERDPFYMRNKKKRYAKKSDEKYDDSSVCSHNNCPILTASTNSPVLTKKYIKSRNICTEILPIKTDRNGRVYILHEENTNNFLINEALKRHHQHQLRSVKSLDYDDKSYSTSPKNGKKDFQNLFRD